MELSFFCFRLFFSFCTIFCAIFIFFSRDLFSFLSFHSSFVRFQGKLGSSQAICFNESELLLMFLSSNGTWAFCSFMSLERGVQSSFFFGSMKILEILLFFVYKTSLNRSRLERLSISWEPLNWKVDPAERLLSMLRQILSTNRWPSDCFVFKSMISGQSIMRSGIRSFPQLMRKWWC